MSAPTRPDKVRAREVLETRVRTRVAWLLETLTRELARYDHRRALWFDRMTHRYAGSTPADQQEIDWVDRTTHRAITTADALATITTEAEAIVAHAVETIWARVHSPLVPGALRAAVLGRAELVHRWPWDERHDASAVLMGLVWELEASFAFRRVGGREADFPPFGGEPKPSGWPADVAPRAVADWAAPLLKDERESLAHFRAAGEAGDWGHIAPPWQALAVLYATLRAVEQDRDHQRAMAIDAGRPHHDLLMGWRDLPKDTRTAHAVSISDHRIELLAPGRSVQLTLALDPETDTLGEAFILALRDLLRETRGWKGLRHWAALQKLLSVEGARQGWVRWTLDGHLAALGTPAKHRSEPTRRAAVARQVEAFTRLELAAYAPDGTLRERAPLLIPGKKYDSLHGSEWKLDGMQLMINPLLYSGVREPNGRLGRNWYPQAAELAQVDDVRHPYTYSLGLILPMRWHLALERDGRDHITLKGINALALAAIPYRPRKPGQAWTRLERDLAELQRVNGLGRWTWENAETARTLEGRLHLWPAPWMVDRTIAGVRPRELPPGPAVLTGTELKAWRARRGLTQTQAAADLKVSRRSILRAEKQPDAPLTTALTAKVRDAGA